MSRLTTSKGKEGESSNPNLELAEEEKAQETSDEDTIFERPDADGNASDVTSDHKGYMLAVSHKHSKQSLHPSHASMASIHIHSRSRHSVNSSQGSLSQPHVDQISAQFHHSMHSQHLSVDLSPVSNSNANRKDSFDEIYEDSAQNTQHQMVATQNGIVTVQGLSRVDLSEDDEEDEDMYDDRQIDHAHRNTVGGGLEQHLAVHQVEHNVNVVRVPSVSPISNADSEMKVDGAYRNIVAPRSMHAALK